MANAFLQHPASYRDPSGFVFEQDGVIYRQVNQVFQRDFEHFVGSGFYKKMADKGRLIPHEEIRHNLTGAANWYTTLKPEKIHFISYPYEWSFDMLKDAALLTLDLAREALDHKLVLKDATPYNVQWHHGRLVFIDSLSFEILDAGKPWIAYRQFCENFLAPLALMHYRRYPIQGMQLGYPEGIPLQVTRSLLPWRSKFSLHAWLHIHLHGKMAGRPPGKKPGPSVTFTLQKFRNLLASLTTLVHSLEWKGHETTWQHYYEEAAQRSDYLVAKKTMIREWLDLVPGLNTLADTGANEGEFSRLAAEKNIRVIATDFDHNAVNHLYRRVKQEKNQSIQPLLIDLANPSPAGGLNLAERRSFLQRVNVDCCLALALVHHLAIGKNIPFEKIAKMYAPITRYLLIEFVPKDDPKVQLMLRDKKDIYPGYTEEQFSGAFGQFFTLIKRQELGSSGRILYLFKNGN